MIEKIFESKNGFLSLPSVYVTDIKVKRGYHSKKHKSGWTISGEVHEDYYTWVEEFSAKHDKYGEIIGNFNDFILVESEESLKHFLKHHPYEDWELKDI